MNKARCIEPIDIHIGNRIRQRRMENGLSQRKLAESIGNTFQQIQKYERGTNRVASSKLYLIAQALGVQPGYFFEEFEGQALGDDGRDMSVLTLMRGWKALTAPVRASILGLIKELAGTSDAESTEQQQA